MTLNVGTPITITAPAGVDGRGEIAVLNDSTSGNFVGWLLKPSGFGGSAVRSSIDDIAEGHGAVAGSFYHGPRAWTLEILMAKAATWALSNARYEKLCRAMNAMAADGSVVWTESGVAARQLGFRREQAPSDPDDNGRVLVAGISPDPRIYSAVTSRGSATSHTFTPSGNADSFPVLGIGTPGATVNISRTSPSPTETLTFTGLSGGGAVTVDFKNHTITQGGVNKYNALTWPVSTWWALQPGVSNTVTITNVATLDWQSAWI